MTSLEEGDTRARGGPRRVSLGLLDKVAMVLERVGPSSGVNLFLRLQGPLDAERLAAAVLATFEQYPVLKARILQRRSRYFFDVSHRRGPPERQEVWCYRHLPASADGGAACRDFERWFVNQPLDIMGGPHFNAALVRVSAEEHRLCLKISHTVCDGVGAVVLMRSLASHYLAGAPPAGVATEQGLLPSRSLGRVLGRVPARLYWRWAKGRVGTARRPRGATPYLIQNLAGYGAGDRGPRLGFEVLALGEEDLGILARAARSLHAKLIEVAIGCALRALYRYNEARGVPPGTYRVGIPIDLRPLAALPMELGNFSSTIPLRVPHAALRDLRRLVSYLRTSLEREKELGTAIVNLVPYALLSPFTSWVLMWYGRKGALPEGTFLKDIPLSYSGPLHTYLIPFGEAKVTDVVETFQLVPVFVQLEDRLNFVFPFVDDGRLARTAIDELFESMRAEIRSLAAL